MKRMVISDCDCAGAEPKPKAVFTKIRNLLLNK